MTRKAPVNKDTWFEYAIDGHCGLCGNSGLINMSGLKTAAGTSVAPLEKVPCICPNGRTIKYAKAQASVVRMQATPASVSQAAIEVALAAEEYWSANECKCCGGIPFCDHDTEHREANKVGRKLTKAIGRFDAAMAKKEKP